MNQKKSTGVLFHPPDKRPYKAGSPFSDAEYRAFFEQGYTIARQVFTSDEVAEMHTAMQRLLQIGKDLGVDLPLQEEHRIVHDGAQFVLEKSASDAVSIKRVCGCGSVEACLLTYSRSPLLCHAFADLLHSDSFEQIINQFHPKEPEDDVIFSPHRDIFFRMRYDPDWQDVNGMGSYVIAFIAVDDVDERNGGLAVLPGSVSPIHEPLDEPLGDLSQEQKDRAIIPSLQAGDVLFMHPYLIHWSEANRSNRSRFSLLSGMCVPGANHAEYPGACTNEIISIP